jgi:hypothetical protein
MEIQIRDVMKTEGRKSDKTPPGDLKESCAITRFFSYPRPVLRERAGRGFPDRSILYDLQRFEKPSSGLPREEVERVVAQVHLEQF